MLELVFSWAWEKLKSGLLCCDWKFLHDWHIIIRVGTIGTLLSLITCSLLHFLLMETFLKFSEQKVNMSHQCFFNILIVPFCSYIGWCPTNGWVKSHNERPSRSRDDDNCWFTQWPGLYISVFLLFLVPLQDCWYGIYLWWPYLKFRIEGSWSIIE